MYGVSHISFQVRRRRSHTAFKKRGSRQPFRQVDTLPPLNLQICVYTNSLSSVVGRVTAYRLCGRSIKICGLSSQRISSYSALSCGLPPQSLYAPVSNKQLPATDSTPILLPFLRALISLPNRHKFLLPTHAFLLPVLAAAHYPARRPLPLSHIPDSKQHQLAAVHFNHQATTMEDFEDYTTKVLERKVKERGHHVPRTKAERVALLSRLALEDRAKADSELEGKPRSNAVLEDRIGNDVVTKSKTTTDAVLESKTTTNAGISVTGCVTYACEFATAIVWYLIVVTLLFALLLVLAWPAAKLGLPFSIIKALPGVYAWLVVPGLATLASCKVIRDIVCYMGLFRGWKATSTKILETPSLVFNSISDIPGDSPVIDSSEEIIVDTTTEPMDVPSGAGNRNEKTHELQLSSAQDRPNRPPHLRRRHTWELPLNVCLPQSGETSLQHDLCQGRISHLLPRHSHESEAATQEHSRLNMAGEKAALERAQELDSRSRERREQESSFQENIDRLTSDVQISKAKQDALEIRNAQLQERLNTAITRCFIDGGDFWTMVRIRAKIPSDGFKAQFLLNVVSSKTVSFIETRKHLRGGTEHIQTNYDASHVFGPSCSNREVFARIEPAVDALFLGHDVCIMCDGQSGSGKSYTLFTGKDAIAPSTATSLFRWRDRMIEEQEYCRITFSALEVYKDGVRDLLAGSKRPTSGSAVTIKLVNNVAQIQGHTARDVDSPDALVSMLGSAGGQLRVSANDKNPVSSRGHYICTVSIAWGGAEGKIANQAALYLVDLAGSEQLSTTNTNPVHNEETKWINGTRAAIRYACRTSTPGPFKENDVSILVRSLKNSGAKLLMLSTVTPLREDRNRTIDTLKFGCTNETQKHIYNGMCN